MSVSSPHPHNPDNGRVYSLQALRGVAAWTVVFSHIMQTAFEFEYDTLIGMFFSTYSHFGVTVFFIISGFVMYQTAMKRRYSAWEFFRGRLVRIVPAYWIATLMLVGAILLGMVPQTDFSSDWNGSDLIKSLLFIPHEHLSGVGEYPVLTVGWSLNYEMFFYAILALCILLFPAYAIHVSAAVIFVLPLLGAGLGPWTETAGDIALYYFFVGIMISLAWDKGVFQISSPTVSACLALAIFCIAAYYLLVPLPFPRFVFSTLLVCVFLMLEIWFRRNGGFLMRISQWLGDVSYSTYLYHTLAIFLMMTAFGTPTTPIGTVAMVGGIILVTLIFSEVSFRLVEQQIGQALNSRSRRRKRAQPA